MFLTVAALLCGEAGLFAATPIKREFRAVWVSTVYCLDWPTYSTGGALQGTSSLIVNTQKLRLRQILDSMKQHRFNVIFFQVRPMSDALYRSSVEPTSSYLTGSRGVRASWDPLEFAVEEAHKRGLELHAWVNPYRLGGLGHGRLEHAVGPGSKGKRLDTLNFERQNPEPRHSRSRAAHSRRMRGNNNKL